MFVRKLLFAVFACVIIAGCEAEKPPVVEKPAVDKGSKTQMKSNVPDIKEPF